MGLLSWLGLGKRAYPPPRLSETEFLALARAAGLDWERSVDALQDAYGTEPCDSSKAVYLPPTTAFTPFPIRFHVRVPGMQDHCPPHSYCADLDLHGSAMKNFRAVGAPLTELLGPGRDDTPSVNVVELHWHIGVFGIRLVAWPPHKDPRNRRTAVFLTITSRVPHAPPDESLRTVAALGPEHLLEPAGAASSAEPALSPPEWVWLLSRENFTTRLNPPGLFSQIDDREPRIWNDSTAGRIGVTGRQVSFAFERAQVIELQQHDIAPARGSGYRALELNLRRARGAGLNRVTLAQSAWQADLARLTRALSEFWTLPVTNVSSLDD